MITIYENGSIELDGKDAGLGAAQGKYCTEVYTREGPGVRYAKHDMPHKRYLLSSSSPITKKGVATKAQFEADLRVLLASL